ncbi:hypothetical protein J6590_075454 [Homalodisca vitripennis]|nr:hypothetical protein J6590_075454 [Homalodisca vitripennis]
MSPENIRVMPQNRESTVVIVRTSLEWLSHHLVPDVVIEVPREHTSDATKRGKYCCNCENIIGVALAPPGPRRQNTRVMPQNGESTVAIVKTSLEWLSHHLVPDVVIDVPREHTSDATKRGKYCCNCEKIIGVALAPPGPRGRDRCPQRTQVTPSYSKSSVKIVGLN